MNHVADLGEHWLLGALKWLVRKLGPSFFIQGCLLLVLFWCLVNGLAASSPRLEPMLLARPVLAGALLAGLFSAHTAGWGLGILDHGDCWNWPGWLAHRKFR